MRISSSVLKCRSLKYFWRSARASSLGTEAASFLDQSSIVAVYHWLRFDSSLSSRSISSSDLGIFFHIHQLQHLGRSRNWHTHLQCEPMESFKFSNSFIPCSMLAENPRIGRPIIMGNQFNYSPSHIPSGCPAREVLT